MQRKPRLTVVLAVAAIVGIITTVAMEGLVRLLEALPFPGIAAIANVQLPLNPYQMPSRDYLGHWGLRPNWSADTTTLAAAKKASGRMEGARVLADTVAAGYNRPLMINADGFKGIPLDPLQQHPRVIGIGDSVTFGLGGWDWPQAMPASRDIRHATLCWNSLTS